MTASDDDLLVLAGAAGLPALPDAVAGEALARGQQQFWEWWAAECRARESEAEAARAALGAERFADRVLARVAASAAPPVLAIEAPVRRVDHAPSYRHPTIEGAPVVVAWAAGAAPLVEIGVAAGAGRALWDEVAELWVDLPEGVPPGRYVALRVAGDSMQPLLMPGDVVLVELGVPPTTGSVIVARDADDGYMVKRVGASRAGAGAGTLDLESINPAYEPVRVVSGPGTVLGRVILRWHVED
jgi:SOS-response transcriptional repressor LexA